MCNVLVYLYVAYGNGEGEGRRAPQASGHTAAREGKGVFGFITPQLTPLRQNLSLNLLSLFPWFRGCRCMRRDLWLFTWALGIQTRVFMFAQQELLH